MAGSNFDSAPAQLIQGGVVVEAETLSNRGAREPLFVEVDCDGDFGLGHPGVRSESVTTDR